MGNLSGDLPATSFGFFLNYQSLMILFKKISGVARPLRFSVCVWRDVGSLLMCLWIFGGFSLGSQIPSRDVLAISFGFVDSIWMRAVSSSDRIFRSRHEPRCSLYTENTEVRLVRCLSRASSLAS